MINIFIEEYFSKLSGPLVEAMKYSVLDGGKRFRPVLALATADVLGRPLNYILPYACAVEFIHTYSLIHDDLPCMDNDDIRRNKLSNHKKFGEAVALLAGDALLTEAFQICAKTRAPAANVVASVGTLSRLAGIAGMAGGQSIDIAYTEHTLESLIDLHKKKTGALIEAAVVGAAQLCEAYDETIASLRKYSGNLGLAFQVKDDLLDSQQDSKKPSFVNFLGYDETQKYLSALTVNCKEALKPLGGRGDFLIDLADYNFERTT